MKILNLWLKKENALFGIKSKEGYLILTRYYIIDSMEINGEKVHILRHEVTGFDEQKVEMPSFIEVIKNVTKDNVYSTVTLASNK